MHSLPRDSILSLNTSDSDPQESIIVNPLPPSIDQENSNANAPLSLAWRARSRSFSNAVGSLIGRRTLVTDSAYHNDLDSIHLYNPQSLNFNEADDLFGHDALNKTTPQTRAHDLENATSELRRCSPRSSLSFSDSALAISDNSNTSLLSPASFTPEGISQPRRDTAASTTLSRVGTRLSRVGTITSAIKKKFGFFDKEFRSHRLKMYTTFAINYLYLVIGFMFVLTVYWGSYYDRTARFKDLKFAVIIDDQQQGNLPPIVGLSVEYFFTNVTALRLLGNFHIWNHTAIAQSAVSHNLSITDEVYRQIHHLKYWAAFYVKANTTLDWSTSLAQAAAGLLSSLAIIAPQVEVVYETGSDYNAVSNYIVTILNNIARVFERYLSQAPIVESILQTLNELQRLSLLDSAPSTLAIKPTFLYHDLIPVPQAVFSAPFQIGLIYLVIFSFFLFVFSMKIHTFIASHVLGLKFVFCRMLASQFSYFILALSYVILNRAFGMKYSAAFGDSGFLVVWMFSYLLMSALGSTIQILVLLAALIKPQLVGFALLFTAVFNVAPTVSPPVLCPRFYHYGYGIPVRNAYELFHVAYFDAWKGRVGRNIGVLIAWMVISNLLMPFFMKLAAKKREQAENAQKSATELEKVSSTTSPEKRSPTDSDHESPTDTEKVSSFTNPEKTSS